MSQLMKSKWIVVIVLILLILSGCSDATGGSSEDNGLDYENDDDDEAPRTFVFSDEFPYPGKKNDCLILDKTPNVAHTVYIYVVNNGENWKGNDVRNIKITYIDLSRPGQSKVINSSQIHTLKDGKKNDLTYIRVDNVIYPDDAKGYLQIEGEIEQGKNKWYQKKLGSNSYNYGNPTSVIPPLNKDKVVYEKEIVQL